jgi:hypothetical protein
MAQTELLARRPYSWLPRWADLQGEGPSKKPAQCFPGFPADSESPFPKEKPKKTAGLERRNKRHGAPGDTGHLVACPLAGGLSSWLGWVTARRRGGKA